MTKQVVMVVLGKWYRPASDTVLLVYATVSAGEDQSRGGEAAIHGTVAVQRALAQQTAPQQPPCQQRQRQR
jgi:hypothetical protein